MEDYGKSILFDDVGMFYIRRHAGQDIWTSTNIPSIDQIINWDKCFYDVFEKFHDKKALHFFPIKAAYFLKGKYDYFLSPTERKEHSFDELVKLANQKGIPLTLKDLQRMNENTFRNYVHSLRKNTFTTFWFRNAFQNIFSIKNSHNKKHKIIRILGIKLSIKRKPAG